MGGVWQRTAGSLQQKSENVLEKSNWWIKTRQIDPAEFRRKSDSRRKEVAEHCRLYIERLLNEGFVENGVTESPREGGSEGNNDATIPPTRAEILREMVRLGNGKAAGESGVVAELLKAG
jgi:hypothetical protein